MTDALPLYPRPIASVFGAIPHPVCEFHIPKGLTTAVLRVLARSRKWLAVQAPKLPRGRPKGTAGAQRLHRRAEAIPQRVGELFEHRHLFARHRLTAAQRATLHRSVRGEPRLRVLPMSSCGSYEVLPDSL